MSKVSIRARNEMRRLRAEGATLLDLAVEFGLSAPGVLYHVRDITPPARARTRKVDYAQAVKLARLGVSHNDIARRFGVSATTVLRAVRSSYALEAAQ